MGRGREAAVQNKVGGEGELVRFRLPVSGRMVALRPPSGAEDLLLAEAAGTPRDDAILAMALAERLAIGVEREPLDWSGLTVTDLDATILRLRQALIGDRVRADVACPAPGCGRRIDIDFRIEAYLAHHTPGTARPPGRGWTVEPADEPGWFDLARVSKDSGATDRLRFRLPTAADLVAVAGDPAADRELARRCLRPPDAPPRLRRRAEAAMEAMAPSFSDDLRGICPECGGTVTLPFDARWFCLRELRDRAAFVYPDVDLLARRYHWSEAEILAMPQVRRAAYAELALQGGGG
jgi:hypothetical protein